MTHPGRKILVADDDADDLELLREAITLVDPEIEVEIASSGTSVMAHLDKNRHSLPDLLVIDYNMPDKNAPALLDMISAHPVYNRIPVVVWSTSSSLLHKTICEQKGALHYFTKPPNFPDIIQYVKKMLSFCRTGASYD